MKSQELWHGAIGLTIIGAGVLAAISVAVALYGPPSFLTVNQASGEATSTAPLPEAPDPLAGAEGVRFECTDERALKALFSERKVQLALSDGRRIALPQTVSASGARYANPDESFVFWNKGDTAFVEESGTRTYDCTVVQ